MEWALSESDTENDLAADGLPRSAWALAEDVVVPAVAEELPQRRKRGRPADPHSMASIRAANDAKRRATLGIQK